METFDAVVVGGGPAGATAAEDLARAGRSVLLLDKAGRIKPCGGAIPPRAVTDFAIPDEQLVARIQGARMVAPSGRGVDMPVGDGYVGMVDRGPFDEFLRCRAASAGAERRTGTFVSLERSPNDALILRYRPKDADRGEPPAKVRARTVIGADGARSAVARHAVTTAETPCVFAYHEIIKAPAGAVAGGADAYDGERCDVYYQGELSPDFYAWVFPHGDTASVGVGSAHKGFSLRGAVAALRAKSGLDGCEMIRHEGAPIPLKPLKVWDNKRDVVLAGDAAGVVAPASGEGIYYAMLGGRLAADAVDERLATNDARALAQARRRFMKDHRTTFMVLGVMQHFWYRNDKRRERFVEICADKDVQELTWQGYMHKRLVRQKPGAHMRIFLKDLGHLFGVSKATS